MKIIKVIFFTLLGLGAIVCTGVFLLFQTFDTDQFLPQITNKVALALGRPVSIGHVGLGLSSRGITLDAAPLTIADDMSFTRQPFVEVDRVRISLDLKSLILHREIHITDILLQSPEIHFIRSLEGKINVQSLGQSTTKRNTTFSVIASEAKQSFKENKDVSQLISSSAPVENGRRPYFQSVRITLQDAAISYIDQSKSVPLDIWLTNINATLNDLSLSRPFRVSFDASLYSNDPNVNGNALVSLDLSKRSVWISGISLHTDLSRLDLEELKGVSPQMPDSPIFKNISGVVQLNMNRLDLGESGDFKASGNIIITGGVIKHFNIIKTALSQALGGFGGLDGTIDKIGGEDTVIEKANAQFSFHDRALTIDNSLVKTDILEFTAKGSMDQGFNMDMDTMLHLNTDASATLVGEIDGIKYLMDDSKRIAIGASLKGAMPHLKYKPNKDFRKKSRKAFIASGGSIISALLGGK